jgi:mandelate racemase
MPTPKLTLKSVDVRAVLLPLKRPVVSKVGLFDQWPMVLIDLYTMRASSAGATSSLI